jgi:hypothetical protein
MRNSRFSLSMLFVSAVILLKAQTVFASAPVEPNDVCVGDTSPETQQLFEKLPAPVYLMKGEDGAFTTFYIEVVEDRTVGRVRTVPIEEALFMCSRGVNVKFIDTTLDPDRGRPFLKDASAPVNAIPETFVIYSWQNNVVGGLYLNTNGASWSETTQWTTFDFVSTNLTNAGGMHAVAILFFDDSAYASSGTLHGNGVIMGDLSERNSQGTGCGYGGAYPSYNSQYEAWWPTGNWIYGGSAGCLSTGMVDGNIYQFEIQADKYNSISYSRNSVYPSPSYVNVATERALTTVINGGPNPLNIGKWSLGFGITPSPTAYYSTYWNWVARGKF